MGQLGNGFNVQRPTSNFERPTSNETLADVISAFLNFDVGSWTLDVRRSLRKPRRRLAELPLPMNRVRKRFKDNARWFRNADTPVRVQKLLCGQECPHYGFRGALRSRIHGKSHPYPLPRRWGRGRS